MTALSPEWVSVLARDVYRLRLSGDVSVVGESIGWRDSFEVPNRMTGVSGAAILTSQTGFGFAARGKNARANEAIVALRGTASLADGITDGRIGLQRGPSGTLVHAGFNVTYQSLKPQLDAFLRGARGVSHVHCIGHSLGGGLATLVADYCADRKLGVELYTFGSPRVGYDAFSNGLTGKVGAEHIYRVYHTNDPVSWVPLFPFIHVPRSGQVMMLPDTYTAYDFASHSIENYVRDVSGRGWRDMACAATNWVQRLDAEVQKWLDAEEGSSLRRYGGGALWMIGRALLHVLRLAVTSLGVGIQSLFSAGLTMLDLLAWILHRAAQVSEQIGRYLTRILGAVLRLIGRVVTTVGEITVAFIRFVLSAFVTTLTNAVNLAVTAAEAVAGR